MSSQQDQLNWRRGLQKPEIGVTEVSHMQHIYTVQRGGGAGPNSGTADTVLKREKGKNRKPKHSYTQTKDRTTARISLPKAGWSCRLSGQPGWMSTWKNLLQGLPFQTSVQCVPGSGREYMTTFWKVRETANLLQFFLKEQHPEARGFSAWSVLF